MSQQARDGDDHERVEDEVQESFDKIVDEGKARLHRANRVLLTTGFLGGLEIGLGVLAYLYTLHETGSHLLAGLAFSIGFIALFLAHSELFTEGFLYPIMAIFAKQGTLPQLLRLWAVTFAMNLLGGWLVMWMIIQAFPKLYPTVIESAHHFLDPPLGVRTICLALLGGAAITLMTRMQAPTRSEVSAIAASIVGAYLLSGLSLFHSVLDSLIIFGAIHAGDETIGYVDWLAWVWWVAPLNVIGGLLLVTAPRLIRSSQLAPSS